MLQTDQVIYLCLDGGAIEDIVLYGKVIASDKKILITAAVQAYGMTPRSFRAEDYGMLVIL